MSGAVVENKPSGKLRMDSPVPDIASEHYWVDLNWGYVDD